MGWKQPVVRVLSGVFNPYGKPLALLPRLQSFIEDDTTKQRRCIHEAAHVLVNHALPAGMPPQWVTVRPSLRQRWGGSRGAAAFATPHRPDPHTRGALLIAIRASRVAETMVFGDAGHPEAYAGDDMQSRELVRALYDEVTPIHEAAILARADRDAFRLLHEHHDKMISLARRLADLGTLSLDEIEQTIGWYRWSRPPPQNEPP